MRCVSTVPLSHDQSDALESVARWLEGATDPDFMEGKAGKYTVGTSHDHPVLAIGGYAGTGKTTVLKVIDRSGMQAVFVTPTHKAASVLRSKLPGSSAHKVSTFHSLIYRAVTQHHCKITGMEMTVEEPEEGAPQDCECEDQGACAHNGRVLPCAVHGARAEGCDGSLCDIQESLRFEKRQYLGGHHVVIVADEASMLTEQQVNDIRSFGLPVLLVGDHGQLPPVKAAMNPWIRSPSVLLTVNHRQGESSGIPAAADDARSSGVLRRTAYGQSCKVLDAASATAEGLLERFQPDAKDRAVICRYNNTRAMMNAYFRRGEEQPLVPGERLISLDRQEDVQVIDESGSVIGETLIFNGSLLTVEEVHGYTSPSRQVLLCSGVLDADWRGRAGTRVLLRLAAAQLGRPDQVPWRSKPRSAGLWDYAYCLSAHKAQGSEFGQVIVLHEGGPDKRWLYTSVTRAKDALVVMRMT